MNYFCDEENEIYATQNNKYTLTNLNDLNAKDSENQITQTFKFFNVNNLSEFDDKNNEEEEKNKQKKLKKKEKIQNLLINSLEKTNILYNFLSDLNSKKSNFDLKILQNQFSDEQENKEKSNINYIKKIDFFNKTIDIFNKKLKSMEEKREISQDIFKQLTIFKKFGFFVEENYKFPEIKENIITKLIYKNCLNFNNIFTKEKVAKKFSMNLTFNQIEKRFDISYDFFDKFSAKFDIYIFFLVRISEKNYYFCINDLIENYANSLVANFDKQLHDFELEKYLCFIYKYLYYKMLKVEIMKITELIKDNFFEYKNFSFELDVKNKEYSIIANYFDNISTEFKIIKADKKKNYEDVLNKKNIKVLSLQNFEDFDVNCIYTGERNNYGIGNENNSRINYGI